MSASPRKAAARPAPSSGRRGAPHVGGVDGLSVPETSPLPRAGDHSGGLPPRPLGSLGPVQQDRMRGRTPGRGNGQCSLLRGRGHWPPVAGLMAAPPDPVTSCGVLLRSISRLEFAPEQRRQFGGAAGGSPRPSGWPPRAHSRGGEVEARVRPAWRLRRYVARRQPERRAAAQAGS